MEHSSQNFDYVSTTSIHSTTPQVNLSEALQIVPVLGLKLSQTPEFLERLQQLAEQQSLKCSNLRQQPNSKTGYSSAKPKSKDVFLHQITNKMKAETFPISFIKIGSWERVSRNEADLVAKCYFAKRKLVWEFLENGLKNKIEFQWSDITSLKVSMQDNQSALLEIELNAPPSFHYEMDPQPRKHTQWTNAEDFTGGQASIFRRHCLEFSPGVLEKPLDKLLKYDTRLSGLMQQDFPTLNSPYFDLSFDSDGKGNFNVEHQQQLLSFSKPYPPLPEQIRNEMPLWDLRMNSVGHSFIHIDDQVFNEMPLWGQGMNNVTDSLVANQDGGMYFAATSSGFQMINSTSSFPNGEEEEALNEAAGLLPSFSTLNDHLQNMSVDNPQIGFYNGITENNSNNYEPNMIDNVVVMSNNLTSSTSGRLIYSRLQSPVVDENNSNNLTETYEPNTVDNVVAMSHNSTSITGGRLIYPQVNSRPQFVVVDENTRMNRVNNNSLFSLPANSDPTMQYFSDSTSK